MIRRPSGLSPQQEAETGKRAAVSRYLARGNAVALTDILKALRICA